MKITNVMPNFSFRQLTITCLLVIPMSTNAAIYMFIQDIKGEVTAKGYQEWIGLDSVQEGMTNAIEISTGTAGRTGGAANILDTTVSKALDRTSPLLRQKLTEGKAIPEVIIVLVATGSDNFQEYFRITLTNAYLTSISMSGGADTVPTESVSLAYEKVIWEYTPFDQTGNTGQPVTVGWDITTNKPL